MRAPPSLWRCASFCPMPCDKSTGRAISSRRRGAGRSRSRRSGRTARRAEQRNTRPTTTPSSCGATTMVPLPRPRRLAACRHHLSCRDCFPRWRRGWRMCVGSRAPGQNSSGCRSLRPNWPLNSSSFVGVPDETVRALAVCYGCTATFLATPPAVGVRHGSPRSLPLGCRRRVNELG